MAGFNVCRQTVRYLGPRGTTKLILGRLLSFNKVFILQKSLSAIAAPNPHRMQLSIAPVDERDWEAIFRQAHCLDVESRREILARANFFRNDLKNCFAVRNQSGLIAHIQWIVFPEENEVMSGRYRHFFNPLGDHEIMIENAFTFPRFRGLGLLTHASRHLLNLAGRRGYRKAVTYVRSEKFASLNELIRLGFCITKVVPEYKVLGFTRRALERGRPGRRKDAGAPAGSSCPGAAAEGKGDRQHELR